MERINLKKSNGFINDYKEMKLLSISEVFNITQRKKYLTIPNVSTPNIDLKENDIICVKTEIDTSFYQIVDEQFVPIRFEEICTFEEEIE